MILAIQMCMQNENSEDDRRLRIAAWMGKSSFGTLDLIMYLRLWFWINASFSFIDKTKISRHTKK